MLKAKALLIGAFALGTTVYSSPVFADDGDFIVKASTLPGFLKALYTDNNKTMAQLLKKAGAKDIGSVVITNGDPLDYTICITYHGATHCWDLEASFRALAIN